MMRSKKRSKATQLNKTAAIKNELLGKQQVINGITFIGEMVDLTSNDAIKNLVYMLKNEASDYVFAIGAKSQW